MLANDWVRLILQVFYTSFLTIALGRRVEKGKIVPKIALNADWLTTINLILLILNKRECFAILYSLFININNEVA